MWFSWLARSFYYCYPRHDPDPVRTETADKAEFQEVIDNFIHTTGRWGFYWKKEAFLDDLADLFAEEDAAIRDEFIAEVRDLVGHKWNFLCNRHEIADLIEEALCDLTDPGGPLNPGNEPEEPTEPETTVQVNLPAGDDVYDVPDNASGTIAGNDGNDTINGADFDDYLAGNRGDDVLSGNGGNDTISGGRGDDVIDGGDGDDLIRGAFGSDTITGGAGADTFALNDRLVEEDNFDFILDFSASEGDQFDLGDIDAGRVTVIQDGADAQILVDGNVQFDVLGASAADVEAAIVYEEFVFV